MSGGDFLEQMARSSRERLAAARAVCPHAALLARVRELPPAPRLKRSAAGFDLIAELKLRSPAVGALRPAAESDADLSSRVRTYARAGAAAVSVLTEPSRFDGALEHLVAASAELRACGIPAMRKDFLVDEYQVTEARACGAGGVLAIVRMLSRDALQSLVGQAGSLGLFVLLEAFDADDIGRMQELLDAPVARDAELFAGVNCRDLATLSIVPERLLSLAPLLPRSVPRVAESGVRTAADAQRVAAAGYELALVGSALMEGEDPGALAAALIDGGRAAARKRRIPAHAPGRTPP